MELREPNTEMEQYLLNSFTWVSKHKFHVDWHPSISKYLWQATIIDLIYLDILYAWKDTNTWAIWSIKHEKPMLVNYYEWEEAYLTDSEQKQTQESLARIVSHEETEMPDNKIIIEDLKKEINLLSETNKFLRTERELLLGYNKYLKTLCKLELNDIRYGRTDIEKDVLISHHYSKKQTSKKDSHHCRWQWSIEEPDKWEFDLHLLIGEKDKRYYYDNQDFVYFLIPNEALVKKQLSGKIALNTNLKNTRSATGKFICDHIITLNSVMAIINNSNINDTSD